MEFASRPESVASAALRRGPTFVLFLTTASLIALCAFWLVALPNIQFFARHAHVDLAGLREAVSVAQTVALHPVEETFMPTATPWHYPSAKPAQRANPWSRGSAQRATSRLHGASRRLCRPARPGRCRSRRPSRMTHWLLPRRWMRLRSKRRAATRSHRCRGTWQRCFPLRRQSTRSCRRLLRHASAPGTGPRFRQATSRG